MSGIEGKVGFDPNKLDAEMGRVGR